MGKEKLRELPVIENLMLKNHGYFDYKKVHNAVPAWLWKYQYKGGETAHELKGEPDARTGKCVWAGWRDITDHVAFKAKVEVYIVHMNAVIVEEENRKVKRNTGHCEVTINATMVKDYKKRFRGKTGELFRQLYERYVIGADKLEDYEDKMYFEMLELIDVMKEALGLA